MSDIEKQVSGSKGRYLMQTGDGEAEMTFSVLSPTWIIVDHTATPDAGRGKGYGKLLFDFLVADARANGFTVIPLCPFVNAMRARHPETADVFHV